jgi:ABC-type lipoprotein release transport system permease subunit
VQRQHEIAVRAALGARPVEVLRLVFGGALRLSLTGVLLGSLAVAACWRPARRAAAIDPMQLLRQ